MTRDFNQYARLLKSLLPRGRAWNKEDPILSQLLSGKAVELARVDSRVDDLLRERDTRTTVELITEHEEDFGLAAGSQSISQRQVSLNTKLKATGSLMPSYYIALAAALGYTITIELYTPAWAGLWTAGQPCGDQQNLFYWTINIHIITSEPPAFATYDDLIDLLIHRIPAHTKVIYKLYGPEYSYAFSSAFSSMPSMNQSKGSFYTSFSSAFDNVTTGKMNGAFHTDFSSAFNTCYAGAFCAPAFDWSFNKVYDAFPYLGGGFDNMMFGSSFDKRINF
jgi:uncharacterized protein YmfQ (DUF2313 family)